MLPKEEIFLVTNGSLNSLSGINMSDGLFGLELEAALQSLLQNYPQIIPGKQIAPESDDPPRFVLLRREMPISGMSLDHLFVDQHGILTLVEAKLLQNPESRRDVIGQIVEYAANAYELWASGAIRQYASEYWSKQGRDLDEVLVEAYGEDLDVELLWETIENNLRQGHIRLIITTDELRPEVRRMIEYLNSELQNAEILGLELKCYGTSDESLVMVPVISGQSESARRTKRASSTSHVTNRAELFSKLTEQSMPVFDHLLELAEANSMIVYWGVKGFSVRTLNKNGKPATLILAYPIGALDREEPFIQVTGKYTADESIGQRILSELASMPGAKRYGTAGVEIAVADAGIETAYEAIDLAFSFQDAFAASE